MTPESILALDSLDPADAFKEWRKYYAKMHRYYKIPLDHLETRYRWWIRSEQQRLEYTRFNLSTHLLYHKATSKRLDQLINPKYNDPNQ